MRYFISIVLILFTINIKADYIVYVKGAPGVVQHWLIKDNGVIQPLLPHQLNCNQYSHLVIKERRYRPGY